MSRTARCLLSALIAMAVVLGGATDHAASAAAPPAAMAGMPCDMAAPASHAATQAPCKSMAAPCCKQMATAEVGLAARFADCGHALRSEDAAWWPSSFTRPGFAREPEILPPRTA